MFLKIDITRIWSAMLGLALMTAWSLTGIAAQLPTLPLVSINTTYTPPSGNTITVNAGGNFQTALNNAQPGDTIVLQAGATFTGPFTLPNKTSGTGWIYIRSSAYSSLPAPGTRVSPSDAGYMPKIVASSGSAISTASKAHHFRFVGIEFKPTSGNFLYNLISIGNNESSAADLPNNITFDRCYIHGDSSVGGRRGVAMDGTYISVIDSYVSDFKEDNADTQALWAHNTPGPLKIQNNYLEAAGENVMFGGADPSISNSIPSDIEIKHNHFFKPLAWIGTKWDVKNLLEFKNARRVLVEGNRFENVWPDAQGGMAILFTVRNQNGGCSWCAVQDITFTLNYIVNAGQGLGITGQDDVYPSQRTSRILVQNNVFEVTGLQRANGRLLQMTHGPLNVTFDHNTGFCTGAAGFIENNPKGDQFVYTNNIVSFGDYGFGGTGTQDGVVTLNTYFTNWQFTKNAIIATYDPSRYPTGNYFPSSNSSVSFVDYSGKNYRLSSSSPYKSIGTDSKDLGADIDALTAALKGTGPAPDPALPPPTNVQVQ